MKKQIINYMVLIALAVMANYPIYKDLQKSVKVAQGAIDIVAVNLLALQSELVEWQEEVSVIQSRVDVVQADVTKAIHNGLSQVDSTLAEIQALKIETNALNEKVNQALQDKLNKALEDNKILKKEIIPGLPGFE